MAMSKAMLAISLLIITFGVGWLLNELEVIEDVEPLWPSLLTVAGVLVVALGGLNKVTVVVGPVLLAVAVLILLDQSGRVSPEIAAPTMLIVVGSLMLVATVSPIPAPRWLKDVEEGERRRPGE